MKGGGKITSALFREVASRSVGLNWDMNFVPYGQEISKIFKCKKVECYCIVIAAKLYLNIASKL